MIIKKFFAFIKERYAYLVSFFLICFVFTYYFIAYLVSAMEDSATMLYIANKNKIIAERVALLSNQHVKNNSNQICIDANLATDLKLLKSSNQALSCAQSNRAIVKKNYNKINALYESEAIKNVDKYINHGNDLMISDGGEDKAQKLSIILNQIYGSLQTDLMRSHAMYEKELEGTGILLRSTEKLLSIIIWLIVILTAGKYFHMFEIKNSKKKILIVEDNRVSVEIIKQIVENENYHPIVTTNGQEALDALETDRNFALVLMDCEMPIMGGFECTSTIRYLEKEKGLPHLNIIALTANVMDGDKERCLAAGMDDYLEKPINHEEFKKYIKKWAN